MSASGQHRYGDVSIEAGTGYTNFSPQDNLASPQPCQNQCPGSTSWCTKRKKWWSDVKSGDPMWIHRWTGDLVEKVGPLQSHPFSSLRSPLHLWIHIGSPLSGWDHHIPRIRVGNRVVAVLWDGHTMFVCVYMQAVLSQCFEMGIQCSYVCACRCVYLYVCIYAGYIYIYIHIYIKRITII